MFQYVIEVLVLHSIVIDMLPHVILMFDISIDLMYHIDLQHIDEHIRQVVDVN
jgi:hypothetical protein